MIEADLNQPPPESRELHDGLLALDVIEHLDDDRAAIGALAKLLKPGGLAVVSVPALPELFSEFDRIQGHRRRYLPETLRAVFAGSGFESPNSSGGAPGCSRVPGCAMAGTQNRSWQKTYAEYLPVPRWPLSFLMNFAFAWEQNWALNGKLTTSTSLFAIAVRGEMTYLVPDPANPDHSNSEIAASDSPIFPIPIEREPMHIARSQFRSGLPESDRGKLLLDGFLADLLGEPDFWCASSGTPHGHQRKSAARP